VNMTIDKGSAATWAIALILLIWLIHTW